MSHEIDHQAMHIGSAWCHTADQIKLAFESVARAMEAPHILMKPTLKPDGDQWCALYGDNLQVGIAGFGDTPAKAMAAFDSAWYSQKTPAAAFRDNQQQEGE